ncbi:MAG TPA: tetratricopeptide repeat protein, partial [Caulobacteraceae bacterium]|nr:tetratricopeptide repeat protein [Caulobacteraceae bacterium]
MTATASGLQIGDLDALLAREPGRVEAHFLRAGLLVQAGRHDEARQDYLAVIALEPTHFGALNDLGTLLYNTDFRTAARTAYAEAVRHHPDNPIGRINLANALLANGEHAAARAQYEAALSLAPDHPDAHQGMANLLQDLGQSDAAEQHRQQSYAVRGITTLPYRGEGTPLRLLLLVSAVGGNV